MNRIHAKTKISQYAAHVLNFFKLLRKGNEYMLLDGKRTRVEGELEEPKEADVLDWEGASHQVPQPVRDDLDKKDGVRCRRCSEPRYLRDERPHCRKHGT